MEFNVGDRCQWEDRDTDEVTGGTVESILPPKVEKPSDWWRYTETEQQEFITYVTVKWDDNTTDTVDMDDLDPEDNDLEREFRTASSDILSDIQRKVKAASKLLQDAVDLSEKHGIPFSSEISFLGQSYFPTTFSDKYGELEADFVDAITGATTAYYGEDAGWEHSDVC